MRHPESGGRDGGARDRSALLFALAVVSFGVYLASSDAVATFFRVDLPRTAHAWRSALDLER